MKNLQIVILCISLFVFRNNYAQMDSVSQDWLHQYVEPDSGNIVMDMTVDNMNNIYVTGSSVIDSNYIGDVYTTIKYSSAGEIIWISRYNHPTSDPVNDQDVAVSIGVDNNLNVYVTGFSKSDEGYYDIATIKYDIEGKEQWVKRYDGPLNAYDEPIGLALDEEGNIYVGGESRTSPTSPLRDAIIIKYNPSGEILWIANYPNVKVTAMLLEPLTYGGNIYLTGYELSSQSADYITLKFDSNGNFIWSRTYNGSGNGWDRANDITLNKNGDVNVTGQSMGTNQPQNQEDDIVTIQYSPDGNVNWIQRYNGIGNSLDRPTRVASDCTGDIYVVGTSFDQMQNFIVLKYSQDGKLLWQASYEDSFHFGGILYSVKIDDKNDIYVSGNSFSATGLNRILTIKYNGLGVKQWDITFGNEHAALPKEIELDDNINIYVSGTIQEGSNWDDTIRTKFVTIKYKQHIVSSIDGEENKLVEFNLDQNYPNPFNPTTTIKFSIPVSGRVSLKIYNVLGQEVTELLDEWRQAGNHSINFNAHTLSSGVYFYSLQWGDKIQINKMLLLK